ncbi:MAG: hypothetical protein Kow0069_16040 [Promethearchaeota archaeon]
MGRSDDADGFGSWFDAPLDGPTWDDVVEGYFLETVDGLLFDVKGVVQPSDWKVAYVRYVPDPGGDRTRIFPAGASRVLTKYRKIYDLEERRSFLASKFPQYLISSQRHPRAFQGVPKDKLARIFDPRGAASELLAGKLVKGGPRWLATYLQDAVDLLRSLSDASGVSAPHLGLTGSALVGLADPHHSDHDLVVYGERACRRVHHAMKKIVESNDEARFYDMAELLKHFEFRAAGTPVSFEQFLSYEKLKTHQGKWRGRDFFVRYVKTPAEVGEGWSERKFVPLARATITAVVADDSERIFTPCRYGLEDVKFVEWANGKGENPTPPVDTTALTLTSFRGRYCEQASVGQAIRSRGTLEMIVDAPGGDRAYQLVVGGSPGDFFVLE